uniref:non-specific serine/threonine protein kinase n=1 Tax=Lepeophtheirus salmonis TaxID=72036 RepID=A0A0K2SVW2_LEPSM
MPSRTGPVLTSTIMGQPTTAVPNGVSSGGSNSVPIISNGNKKAHRSGYNAKAMAEIRNSLRPFEQQDLPRPVSSLSTTTSCSSSNNSVYNDSIQCLVNMGFDEELSSRALVQCGGRIETALDLLHKQYSAELASQEVVNGLARNNTAGLTAKGAIRKTSSTDHHYPDYPYRSESPATAVTTATSAPALPPRTNREPPRVPDHPPPPPLPPSRQQYVDSAPPPLPPPRNNNPPTPPPRGTTPPPPPPPPPTNPSYQQPPQVNNSIPPPLLRRMSPIPGRNSAQSCQPPPPQAPSSTTSSNRGNSPVQSQPPPPQPMRVHNSREIKQQFAQTLQSMQALSVFPGDHLNGQAEPPPPYPMGTAAMTPNPPPSYSQSLAMRQSPTLSSTSSTDYRRSPAPGHPLLAYSVMATNSATASPTPSVISNSSSTRSSVQAWPSRQTKTHSPIIMQSVKSTQVQKPVLQTAVAPSPTPPSDGSSSPPVAPPTGAPPPPSYEFSMQQKQQRTSPSLNPPPPPLPPNSSKRLPIMEEHHLPPPPPYPSTALGFSLETNNHSEGLVNATAINAKASPVISTAKVVSNANLVRTIENKPPLQRKYSPLTSETGSSASRSESPVSDSQTVSAASPLSFLSSSNEATTTTDSGVGGMEPSSIVPPPPPYKTTHHTSPKPERKKVSAEKEEVRKESLIRNCPPQAFKFFMEQHIENVIKESKQRRARQMRLEKELAQLNVKDPVMSEQMRCVLRKKETNYLRMKRAKLNKKHFKKIKTIGVGAFGEVSLVRNIDQANSSKTGGGLYAMKTLKKSHVVDRNQVAHVIAEKDILAEADNDWIVKLYYSFQDKDNLYFVMEYIPGGDLMSLLIKLGIFEESMAKFYVAELACAVDSVHKMGFIHRDIKPDNILIDSKGHIKLTDFGLCTGFRWTHNSKYYQKNGDGHCRQDSMDPGNLDLDSGRCSCPSISNGLKPLERRRLKEHQRCMAHSLVGTPNYIAPEVLLRQGYTQLCDWWSVGVILYEMLVGQPPFHANSPAETQYKVINWEHTLHIPRGAKLSEEAKDLIKSLCILSDRRLGKNGSEEIKCHPFFKGIDFSKPIRTQPAPYKPDIMYETDTSNFDPIDPDRLRATSEDDEEEEEDERLKRRKDYHRFYEFTFRRFFDDGGHPLRMEDFGNSLLSSSSGNSSVVTSPPADAVYV